MSDLSVSFGALVKPLAEQLAEVGLEVSDPAELARIQIIADAVSVVAVHGLMPRSQSDRARQKLASRLAKIVAPSPDKGAKHGGGG